MPWELLVGAIVGLVGAIGVLWRQLLIERRAKDEEKARDARLVFALLGERARSRSERPPPTVSTPERPDMLEARALAIQALNGDLDDRLRDYLDGPPTKDESTRYRFVRRQK